MRIHRSTELTCGTLAFGLALMNSGAPVSAITLDPVADFYSGKVINLYIGYTVGGTYDLYARLVARYIGKHIPGQPLILPRNMTGGGSRIAAGYVAKVAVKDGLSLATANQSFVIEQAMGDKSLQFDVTTLNYIGNPIVVNNVLVTWAMSNVNTIADAKVRLVTMGATGGTTSSQYPRATNALLGTKFKIIYGYPGGNEINMAMENGEVDGRGSNDWVSWKATKPDWLRDHKLNVLVQIGQRREADLANVPLLSELASNDADKQLLELLSSPIMLGRQIFTAPGVPSERIAALRAAFDQTMTDPDFLSEARHEKLDINPVSGQAMQDFVSKVIQETSVATGQRLLSIVGDNGASAER
jgi:tripartite-type tricarboxylate transporter receptor subunit TctC